MQPPRGGLWVSPEKDLPALLIIQGAVLPTVGLILLDARIKRGMLMLHDEVPGINDHAGFEGAKTKFIIRIDTEIVITEKGSSLLQPGAGEDGDAEQIIEPMPVADAKNRGSFYITQSAGKLQIPALLWHPIIRELHQNITPAVCGRKIPGSDAALSILLNHETPVTGKTLERLLVIGVDGE